MRKLTVKCCIAGTYQLYLFLQTTRFYTSLFLHCGSIAAAAEMGEGSGSRMAQGEGVEEGGGLAKRVPRWPHTKNQHCIKSCVLLSLSYTYISISDKDQFVTLFPFEFRACFQSWQTHQQVTTDV